MTNSDSSALPGRGIKPLVSLIAHPVLALVIFTLVLLAGIPFVFIKGRTLYSAAATVQVAPSYMKNLRDDGELSFPSNTQYREFLQQQVSSVLRYDIVQEALRSLGQDGQRWYLPGESERLTVDRLRNLISVRAIPDTYMIEISMQNEGKIGVAELINAVVETYVERMRVERVYGADVRARTLETREKELVGLIQQKTERRTGMVLQLGISAFSGKEENPYDRVLANMRSALAETRNKRFEAEARYNAFLARGETDINTRSIQEAVLIDPGLANLKSNLYKRRADLLTQLAGLTPAHPAYNGLEDEARRIDAEITAQTGSLSTQVRGSVLARFQTTVDQTRQVERDLARDLAEQEKLGANFANLYNQAMTLTLDLDQDRKELDAVRERLNQFAAEQDSFGFVRMVNPALPPERPFGPGKKKILLLVLMAALAAGLAAPIGRDMMDRRVHTLNDAERILGIPALGWMVERTEAATHIFAEDLLRRMANALLRDRESNGTRVFAFSAVKPGAGTSDLVLSLGKTLTALGYPALIVEANAFMPDQRMRPDQADQPGLIQLLEGQADPAACVTAATPDIPARIWLGQQSATRHLDRIDQMGKIGTLFGDTYAFILVDIPPLLLSADAEMLARQLQHLILLVEAGSVSSGELRRAGRELEKIQPAAVGLVVNRVRPFAGGGYLRELMLEYLTGRKISKYFTEPVWLIQLRAGQALLARWIPRLRRHKA